MNDSSLKLVSKIELWPIEKIKPFPRNPKKHPEEQIIKICKGIQEFGFLVPVLLDEEGEIIAGHGRMLSAIRLNLAEVPVILIDHLTPTQIKAFRIADNKLNESPWDTDLLAELIGEIEEEGGNLDAIGYDETELNQMLDGLLQPAPVVSDGVGRVSKIEIDDPDTMATIGEYRFVIPHEAYVIWMENLRQDVGFDKQSVITELRRRLGL